MSFILFVENYFCIVYICCNSKTLSVISSDKIFIEVSYNGLLGIIIPELLMNLVSCHVFTKKHHSTVILLFQSHLVNYYLAKSFVIIKQNSSNLGSFPNDVKLIIHVIDKQKTYYVMACTTEIYSL